MQEDVSANPSCPRINFSEAEIAEFFKPWSKALVVRVLERSFALPALRRRLEFLWGKNGRIQVTDLSNDFFLVRFSDLDDYNRAAFNGPWKMYDYYITVARWTPEFNEEEPLRTILTWVRLPKLPIHFFNKTAVTRIGNHIGSTVRLDLARAEGARARYARVCIEVDLSKPLLGKYMIGDRVFYVEYECLENLCFTCEMYGHKLDSCPTTVVPSEAVAEPVPEEDPKLPNQDESDIGSWMTVTRRNRKKSATQQPSSSSKPPQGSRFTILHNESVPGSKKEIVIESSSHKPSVGHKDGIESLVDITAKVFPGSKKPQGHPPKPPLGDVTNILMKNGQRNKGSDGKTKMDSELGVELVQVPVVYDETTFDASRDSKGTKPKKASSNSKQNRSARPPARQGSGTKAKAKVKSFVTKGPENASAPTGMAGSGTAPNAGRPPDAL
ncbi:hypothetical protein LINPERHAP2_LOCUS29023 [Linum perenne]